MADRIPSSSPLKAPSSGARRDASAKRYARAQSHSRRVSFLKYFLPAAAVIILAAAVSYVWVVRSLSGIDAEVDVAGTAIRDGNLVMANPKIAGTTGDNRAYRVEALRALQPIGDGAAVTLEDIHGTFHLQEGLTGTLRSQTGLLEDDNTKLTLSGPSVFETSDGLVARFDQAMIDMEAGTLQTSRPVRIEQPGAIIEAESMRVEEGGKRIVFESNVTIAIDTNRVRSQNPATVEESRLSE